MKNLLINFIIVLVLGTTITTANAQIKRSTGLVWDDNGYQETPHLPRYEGRKYNNVPLTHSLVKYAPSIIDQGLEGSCVPHAVAYGALTIENAIKQNVTDQNKIDEMAFSIDYVFNQIKVGACDEGSRITDALALLKEKGNTPLSSFDVDNCLKMPTVAHHEEALDHRIKDYAALFSYAVAPEVKIDKVRKTIADNHPVPVGMRITASFFMVKEGQEFWTPSPTELVIGGHAMLVVGYDEVDKSFLLMNSWGKDWGKDGFIKVKYDAFAMACKYAFQMVLEDKEEVIVNTDEPTKEEEVVRYVNMSGDFVYRYPTGYTTDEQGNQVIAFEEAKAEYDTTRGVHTLVRKDWRVGDVFQLVAKNVPAGKNVYVFSIDAADKADLHWPVFDEAEEENIVVSPMKDEAEQDVDAYNKVKIANFVPSSSAEIIMPGAESALQLAVKGEDNLVVLYSDEVIEDINKRIEQIRTTKGEFKAAFNLAFGDLLMPSEDITYAPNAMNFKARTQEGNPTVVPIILSVVAN